jgi:hypothetical protein
MREPPTGRILTEKRGVNGDSRFRALGFLPLLFFLAQGVHYWRINELDHMLWMCNIGNLLLALGLFFKEKRMIRAAAIWTIPGLVAWLLYVVPTWGVVLASVLAHVGGLVVGLVALRRVGVERGAWLDALGWYFVVQLISRLITRVDLNVNVSQRMYSGWDRTFNAYWKFWLVLSLLVAMVLWIITSLLNKLWPRTLNEQS